MSHQQISLGFLFSFLNPGGLYIIEDLATSIPGIFPNHKDFPAYLREEEKISTLDFLKMLESRQPASSPFMSIEEIKYLHKNCDRCEIYPGIRQKVNNDYHDPTIAVIHKSKSEKY